MEDWLKQNEQSGIRDMPLVEPILGLEEPKSRPLPPGKPIRREEDTALGRPKAEGESTAGTVSRAAGEVGKQAAGGVIDAVHNAFTFINPLGDWLNDNVTDLRFNDNVAPPKTTAGAVTRKLTEFLTGFIPSMKVLKAAGITNAAVQGVTAGALADFAVRDPHEGRLADLWNGAGLPKNVLTDYLASKPDDSEIEGRFKNSLESMGLGAATEGVLLAARALRAARAVKEVRTQEIDYLRGKYGEVTDAEFRTLGDTKKDVVSVAKVSDKLYRGEGSSTVISKNPLGTWITSDPKVASKYGKVVEYDQSKLNAYDFSSPALNKELSDVAGFKINSSFDINASIDEASPGAKKIIKWLKAKGYNAVKANDEESAIFVIDDKALTPYMDPRALVRAQKGQPLPEDWGVYINFARIDEPKQIQFAMGKMAEAMKGQIDEATRGTMTHAEMTKLADDFGMSVTDLLARRKGEAFSFEQAMSARQIWAASGEKLVEAAKLAAGKNAGPIDQFNFRKMMALHSAIQAEVIGGRTETARSLASWAIPAGSSVERARAIDQIMGAMGGPGESAGMARRLALLADAGVSPAVVGQFAARGAGATTMDAIKEIWVNGLLSSPSTHVVNVTSNSLVALQSIYERATAGVFREIIGGDGVRMGEAAAMTHGMMESVKDAFVMSARSLRTGDTGLSLSKVDLARTNAISADAFRMSRETGLGRFVDFMGKAATVPGRLLGAEDEFFKTIGYRMELRAQAFRQASSEGLVDDAFRLRYQSLVDNPTDVLKINAADSALYQTFTNETGWFGNAIMNMRNAGGGLNPAFFVLPFVRTPVNIARYAFERTPFAPLVGQWRADIAAGGARADLALARMSTGTAIMLTVMDYTDSGFVSGQGPADATQREALLRQGWQPYSIQIGGRWHSYNRTDPLGMTLGFAASIAEAVRRGEVDQEAVDEWHEVTAMTIAAVSQVAINKTYMEGFAKLVEVMSDPKRYTQKYVDDLVASFVPLTSLSSAVKNAVDPVQREVGSPQDAVMARIAGLSEQLTPRRDLWGKEITSESGMGKFYDFLSPVRSKAEQPSPIDREIVRLGKGPERVPKQTAFDGVQANFRFYPKAYDDYTRLAGNDLKHPAWGMGAKDYLNSVVDGKHPLSAVYSMLSDQSRKDFISSTVGEYRRLAAQQVLQDPKHKDFAAEIAHLKQLSNSYKMPVLGVPQ
jgi:hypothetical protein